jgi:hypothetical protein
MPENIRVGTILTARKEWPGKPPLETKPCFEEWRVVQAPDAFFLSTTDLL